MGDNTYLNQPKFMSLEIVKAFAENVNRHCKKNKVPIIHIAFHGGEPLLAGQSFFKESVKVINSIVEDIKVEYVIQTNGTLLDESWLDLFNELKIQAGISVDGPKQFHDAYRVYHNNKGSYDEVIRGIEIRNKKSIGGLISVVNINVPPAELYRFYLSVNAKSVNILLPDNHYDNLPPGINNTEDRNNTLYGDWLIALYDCWSIDPNINKPKIPFFGNIIGLILGYEKGDELIGKRKNRAITIETDGAIEVVDPLRICGNGFTRNNLNVTRNEISEIEALQLFQAYYDSHDILCDKCRDCPVQNVCGGGYLGHRYSKHRGFNNPSIYCKDLMKLILHIQNDIVRRLPENIIEKLNLEIMLYDEAYRLVHELNPVRHY